MARGLSNFTQGGTDYILNDPNTAPEFSSSAAYKAGEFVNRDGNLYRFTVDHAVGAWSADEVTQVLVGNEIIKAKRMSICSGESIKNGAASAMGCIVHPFIYGGLYSTANDGTAGEYIEDKDYCSVKIPCEEGDVFHVHVYGNGGALRQYAFFDSNGGMISRGSSGELTRTLTAPADSAFVIFNNALVPMPEGYYVYQEATSSAYDGYPTEGSNNAVKSDGLRKELDEIRNAIGTVNGTLTTPEYSTDYFWSNENETAEQSAYNLYVASDAVQVTPGQYYRVYARQGTSSKAPCVIFTDGSYKILAQKRGVTQAYGAIDVQAPEGAVYMLINSTGNYYGSYAPLNLSAGRPGMYNFYGKNIAIIGDSISTNGDWKEGNPLGNVPEIVIGEADVGVQLSAYATFYDIGTTVGGHEIVAADVGTEITFTPVAGDVGKVVGKPKNNNDPLVVTWWEVAQAQLGFNVIPVCWSGSSITAHEENDYDTDIGGYIYKCAHAWHPSQIRKCGIRTPGSMTRTAPDMIIIYRGTNDLTHSDYSYITDYLDDYPTQYPETDTYDDGGTTRYDYAKGMRLLIKKLRDAYPDAKLVLCTMNYFRRISTDEQYTNNGTDTWQKYNATIRRLAAYEGCDLIEFDKDGLTWSNAAEDYYQDGNGRWTHPTTKGHAVMGNRALLDLANINNV